MRNANPGTRHLDLCPRTERSDIGHRANGHELSLGSLQPKTQNSELKTCFPSAPSAASCKIASGNQLFAYDLLLKKEEDRLDRVEGMRVRVTVPR